MVTRVQLSAVGVHHVVMNGITYATKGSLFQDSPPLAVRNAEGLAGEVEAEGLGVDSGVGVVRG